VRLAGTYVVVGCTLAEVIALALAVAFALARPAAVVVEEGLLVAGRTLADAGIGKLGVELVRVEAVPMAICL
jgi:hypothetical protein